MFTDTLYLSPEGNDQWDGLQPTFNEDNSGPKASIEGIMEKIQKMRPKERVTVIVEGGYYNVPGPIVLDGKNKYPVTFQAEDAKQPVFTRAIRIKHWQECKLNGIKVLKAEVKGIAPDHIPECLYVNRKRKKIATFPKGDELYRPTTPDYEVKKELFNGAKYFRPAAGDYDAKWKFPEDIRVRLFIKWIDALLPIDKFDVKSGNLYFKKYSLYEMDPEVTEYRFENVREALLEPGEWYYESESCTMYYVPEEGQTAGNISTLIPGRGTILRLEGDLKKKKYVENIEFRGIQFEFGGGKRPQLGMNYDLADDELEYRNYGIRDGWKKMKVDLKEVASSPQAAVDVPGVIFLRGVKNCGFYDCIVTHSSWYGIEISCGCENITVDHCSFYDLGGGGIKAGGGPSILNNPSELTCGCVLTDNHISHCGLDHYASVGIIILNAFGCLVEHNHIHDLYYSGISCGWVWGYADSVTRENRIGWNHIHDLGKGLLSDMGGIYLLGTQPGTRVYNNLIHDVTCRYYGGWGLYTDEGSSHIILEQNACFNCSCEGFHQHYGRENIIRNNIFAYGGEYGIAITTGTERDTGYAWNGKHYSKNFSFYENVIITRKGKPFYRAADKALNPDQVYCESNCFYDPKGKYKPFFRIDSSEYQGDFEEWQQEKRHDLKSILADPGFMDLDNYDFRLKPDSPLHNTSFVEFNLSKVGIRIPETPEN